MSHSGWADITKWWRRPAPTRLASSRSILESIEVAELATSIYFD